MDGSRSGNGGEGGFWCAGVKAERASHGIKGVVVSHEGVKVGLQGSPQGCQATPVLDDREQWL